MWGLFFFAIVLLICCGSPPSARAETKVNITFTTQDGILPDTIRIETTEGRVLKEIKFSESTKQITLLAKQFAKPLDRLVASISYSQATPVTIELRLLIPLSDPEEKEVFLIKPKGRQNYKATQDAIDLLKDRRKASEPYIVCKQSYATAQKLDDKQTQIDAAFCWLIANSRLVFADPDSSRRLYGPDTQAIEAVESLMRLIDENSGDEGESWRKALEKSRYARDYKKALDEITRLKLSHWMFYADRTELMNVHGATQHCNLMAIFRDDLTSLTVEQKARLQQPPFRISQQAISSLEAPVTQASTDQTCNTPGRSL